MLGTILLVVTQSAPGTMAVIASRGHGTGGARNSIESLAIAEAYYYYYY